MQKIFNVYADWKTPSGKIGKHESTWHGPNPSDVMESVRDMLQNDNRKRIAGGLFISVSERKA